MVLRKMALLIFLQVFGMHFAHGQDLRGKLLSVHDGDTITILSEGKKVRVRLENIDAPELLQPWGINSRENLRAHVDSKMTLVIHPSGQDRYKRVLGEVILPDGSSLNRIQVVSGNAWIYRKYCKDLRIWCKWESFAQNRHLGLWSQRNPVAPWNYRHRRK